MCACSSMILSVNVILNTLVCVLIVGWRGGRDTARKIQSKEPALERSTLEDNKESQGKPAFDYLKDEREYDSNSQKDLDEDSSQDRQSDLISQMLLKEHKTQSLQHDNSSEKKLEEESIQDTQSETCKEEASTQDDNDPRDPQSNTKNQVNRDHNSPLNSQSGTRIQKELDGDDPLDTRHQTELDHDSPLDPQSESRIKKVKNSQNREITHSSVCSQRELDKDSQKQLSSNNPQDKDKSQKLQADIDILKRKKIRKIHNPILEARWIVFKTKTTHISNSSISPAKTN